MTAYSPLTGTYDHIPHLSDIENMPEVQAMMKKYNKNVGQIVLRWHIQKYPERYSVIPKSSHPERVRGNLNVRDFRLSEEEMGFINSLDRGVRGCDPAKIWDV